MNKQLLQQALEALTNSSSFIFIDRAKGHLRQEAIDALRVAIAQPVHPAAVALKDAAQAVLDRWNSPVWEWHKQGPTADLMHALRVAIEQPDTTKATP